MASVLIIDDDPEIRSVLRVALQLAGHQVREADDGALGIRAYRQEPADLILCDLLMPGKEGLETIRELRSQFADVKIVAMSGGVRRSKMDFLQLASKFGAMKVLHKPFDLATLQEVVDEALAQSPSELKCHKSSLNAS